MIGGKCWWLCLPNIVSTEIVQYLPGTVNPQPSAVTSNSLSESHKPPQKVHHTVEDHCIYGDVEDNLAPNLFVVCSDFIGNILKPVQIHGKGHVSSGHQLLHHFWR